MESKTILDYLEGIVLYMEDKGIYLTEMEVNQDIFKAINPGTNNYITIDVENIKCKVYPKQNKP